MNETNAHPIERNNLKAHYKEVGRLLDTVSIKGRSTSLFEEIKKIDSSDPHLYTRVESDTLEAIRDALCVMEYIQGTMKAKLGVNKPMSHADDEIAFKKKVNFANTYAMFAGCAYATSCLENIVSRNPKENVPIIDVTGLPCPTGEHHMSNVKYLLTLYTGLVRFKDTATQERVIRDGQDLAHNSKIFFKSIIQNIMEQRDSFADLIDSELMGVVFTLEDFTLRGFQYDMESEEQKVEFEHITPERIVGNEMPKKMLIRFADRLFLYNVKEQHNPVLELGGIPFSIMLDGPPGTGKSSLMKMFMTRAELRAEQVNLRHEIHKIDCSAKDEFYGKTQKQFRQQLNATVTPSVAHTVLFDDVDLMLVPRSSSNMAGADQDVLYLTMDFLSGALTVVRGNTIVISATNKATAIDDAVRQRHSARYVADGPTKWEHFAYMFMDKMAPYINQGLLKLPTGKFDPKEVATSQPVHSISEDTKKLLKHLKIKTTDNISFEDIGRMCTEYRIRQPTFTGRAMVNVMEALQARSADYDVPEEFFTNPGVFRSQPFETQVGLIGGLHVKLSPEIIVQELDRYFLSEVRYAKTADDALVEEIYRGIKADFRAKQIFIKENE